MPAQVVQFGGWGNSGIGGIAAARAAALQVAAQERMQRAQINADTQRQQMHDASQGDNATLLALLTYLQNQDASGERRYEFDAGQAQQERMLAIQKDMQERGFGLKKDELEALKTYQSGELGLKGRELDLAGTHQASQDSYLGKMADIQGEESKSRTAAATNRLELDKTSQALSLWQSLYGNAGAEDSDRVSRHLAHERQLAEAQAGQHVGEAMGALLPIKSAIRDAVEGGKSANWGISPEKITGKVGEMVDTLDKSLASAPNDNARAIIANRLMPEIQGVVDMIHEPKYWLGKTNLTANSILQAKQEAAAPLVDLMGRLTKYASSSAPVENEQSYWAKEERGQESINAGKQARRQALLEFLPPGLQQQFKGFDAKMPPPIPAASMVAPKAGPPMAPAGQSSSFSPISPISDPLGSGGNFDPLVAAFEQYTGE